MKQINNWMVGAILIFCASAFTSCTNKDTPVSPSTGIVEKMLGVWMCEEIESGISPNFEKVLVK